MAAGAHNVMWLHLLWTVMYLRFNSKQYALSPITHPPVTCILQKYFSGHLVVSKQELQPNALFSAFPWPLYVQKRLNSWFRATICLENSVVQLSNGILLYQLYHIFQIQVKAKMSVNNTQIHIHVPEPLAVSETLITFPSIGNYNIRLITTYHMYNLECVFSLFSLRIKFNVTIQWVNRLFHNL